MRRLNEKRLTLLFKVNVTTFLRHVCDTFTVDRLALALRVSRDDDDDDDRKPCNPHPKIPSRWANTDTSLIIWPPPALLASHEWDTPGVGLCRWSCVLYAHGKLDYRDTGEFLPYRSFVVSRLKIFDSGLALQVAPPVAPLPGDDAAVRASAVRESSANSKQLRGCSRYSDVLYAGRSSHFSSTKFAFCKRKGVGCKLFLV